MGRNISAQEEMRSAFRILAGKPAKKRDLGVDNDFKTS